MLIKFWGVRGSIPAPISTKTITEKIIKALSRAQDVNLDDPQAVRNYVEALPLSIRGTTGGNTSCVEVTANERRIILDAGTGLRELGNHLMKGAFGRGRGTAHIFMTHTHWDHLQGFPFFDPAYIKGNRFFIYSPKKDIKKIFTAQQAGHSFPVSLEDMDSRIEFIYLSDEGVDLGGGVTVRPKLLPHPGESYAYRIEDNGKAIIFATDCEYNDLKVEALQPYLDFFFGAEALIFDSMYTFSESVAKEGWGHSTSLIGVDLAAEIALKRLILFHHEPNYSDEQIEQIIEKTTSYYSLVRQQGHLEILLAYEGLTLEI